MQTAIVEIEYMLFVKPLRLGVGVGHADRLRKTGAIGRLIGRVARRDAIPIPLHQRLGADVTRERQVGIGIGVVDAEIIGLD